MKIMFFLGVLLFSLVNYAQKNEVGEKTEPQCGEPCSTCPGEFANVIKHLVDQRE